MDNYFLRKIQDWYREPVARWILDQEKRLLASLWPHYFGHYLLQMGLTPACQALTEASRIRSHINVMPVWTPEASIVSEFQELPFANDSIDAVFVHHWLGLVDNPHEALEEIYRVLLPEGHLIICGLHPAWWYGLSTRVLKKKPFPPELCSPRISTVTTWLQNRGFATSKPLRHSYGLSLRLYKNTPSPFFNKLQNAASFLPCCGGGYIIVAQKRLASLIPIKPRWTTLTLPFKPPKPAVMR